MAPTEWTNREILWNAVEEAEKTKDSRLAREFVVALPVELDRDEQIALLTDFIQTSFVAEGMCADVCIHDTDGHNPHAHIMLTVRPLTKDGKWQHKTEKEYLCVRDGEEQGFNAAEFKAAQGEGWEKQYQYKVGKKKVYMPPSQAEAQGYERISKYPKSTKYGRQNPISERWNSEGQLILWRTAWADVTNRFLERAGIQDRVDHRSHAERGLTVPAIAEAMETVRQKMIIFRYRLLHIGAGKEKLADTLQIVKPDLKKYENVIEQLKGKIRERRTLLGEKKATPAIQVFRHRDLAQKIAALTENIEELKSEKALLLNQFNCVNDYGMVEIKKRIVSMESSLEKLDQQEMKYTDELEAALVQYTELQQQSADMDTIELDTARHAIRPDKEYETLQRLQAAYGKKVDSEILTQSRKDIAKILDEPAESVSIRQQIQSQSVYLQKRRPHQINRPDR